MENSSRNHILVVSDDVVDISMGGVGVRNWELAHTLAAHCDVTLAIPNKTGLTSSSVAITHYDRHGEDLRTAGQSADAILVQGFVLHFQKYLAQLGRPIAVDLYVPSLLESLAWHDQSDWETWIPEYEEYLRVQHDLIRQGDFFYCASERQRDYWLGWLHSEKRLNPHTYRQSSNLRRLIDVVPFGIPSEPPPSHPAVLKGVHPGIKTTDRLLLWSGGLWDWLDPLTLVRAVAEMVPQHPEIKLYFLGTTHPNPVVSGMRMAGQAKALSDQLGILDRYVFFGDWTPYSARGSYLAEADLAVITHPDHIETHFSFRTRVLDCIWAGLPVISTHGDILAEWIAENGLGLVVPPNDVPALSAAILQMLDARGSQTIDQAFAKLRNQLRWENTALPLIQYCRDPYPASDKGLYLTESEKISRDKDAFLEQVILEKDTHTGQVIREKDGFLAQVVHDKDAFFEQVLQEKDAHLQEAIRATEEAAQKDLHVQQMHFEQIISEKDATITFQQQQIEKYQGSLPLRIYAGLKRLVGR